MSKDKNEEPKVEEKVSKKVCPVCGGRGWDDASSPDDKCNSCGGTGEFKEIK